MKKLIAVLALSFLCTFGARGVAQASVNDFVVNSFKVDYRINNLKTGGALDTTEQIDLTFSDQNHGILRAIPKSYHGYSTKLNVLSVERDGHSEPYTTNSQNNNLVLKIGDANKTITGQHVYKIRYLQERVINFSDNGQEFYWDTNGTQWQQAFGSVEAHLGITGEALDPSKAQCYTGVQGSVNHDCQILSDGQGGLLFKTTSGLSPYENMTIAAPIKTVVFAQPSQKERLLDNARGIAGLVAGLLVALVAFVVWLKKGRDYKGRGVIIPEYDPPKGLTPAEVGLLADYSVDGRDISSTLIDLAVRGYIRIHDDSKKFWLFTNRNFWLELLNPDFDGLKNHEAALLSALFSTNNVGDKIELGKLDRVKMYNAVQKIRKDLMNNLTKAYGLVEPDGQKLQIILITAGIVSGIVIAVASQSFLGIAGAITAVFSCILVSKFMPRRSHAGVETYEKVKGLELYMKTAEKERLKMLQSVERPYAEPKKTVELFEKLLPFAVALGVEKSWAKQFDDVLTGEPGWYTGSSLSAFNAGYLASSLTDATSDFSRSFESSSGTSGSSGGGSSGGGGGGGGGGGW